MAVSDYRNMARFPVMTAEELERELRAYDRLENKRDVIGLGMHCSGLFERLVATADHYRREAERLKKELDDIPQERFMKRLMGTFPEEDPHGG